MGERLQDILNYLNSEYYQGDDPDPELLVLGIQALANELPPGVGEVRIGDLVKVNIRPDDPDANAKWNKGDLEGWQLNYPGFQIQKV